MDKIAVCIGALDIANIVWMIADSAMKGTGFGIVTHFFSRNGSPMLVMLGVLDILTYTLILACGITLVLRRSRFAWLNYILFPLRLAFFLPTLFPVFMLVGSLGLVMNPYTSIGLLVSTEIACCVFIFYWRRSHRRCSSTGAAVHAA